MIVRCRRKSWMLAWRPSKPESTRTCLLRRKSEKRFVDRRVDHRLCKADDSIETRIARRSMDFLFELQSVDRLVRGERHRDRAVPLLVNHLRRQRRLRIERDAPVNSALRLDDDRSIVLDRHASVTPLGKEDEEH